MKHANEPSEVEPAPRKRGARKQSDAPRKEFNRLKLNGAVYEVNDVVVIKEHNDDRCYGTILQIWSQAKGQAFIHLRWFYKPSDVFGTSIPGFIGADELFDSSHEQDVHVQAAYDKVRVLSFEEYFNRREIEEDIFFSRAKYLPASRQLDPPIEEWPTVCVCKAVKSPNDVYLECEQCGGLYHFPCVSQSQENVNKDWVCKACRN